MKSTTNMMRWAILAACLSCGGATGEAGDDAANDPCVPGASIACTCEDESPGARVCEPDGVGYDECVCDGDATESSAEGPSTNDDDGPGTADDGPDTADDGPGTDPTASDTNNDGTASDTADDTSDTSGGVPIFERDIVPILYDSCGAANPLCHARNAYFPAADQGCRGWLSFENAPLGSSFDDLDPDTQMPSEGPVPGCSDKGLHERLMLLAPWECGADARYVVPGSPEQSYIFQKLTNGMTCGDFRIMPPPDEGYEITADQIATLEAWIVAGALP